MGMPDTSGLVKLYVSFYQENYLLWIYCKLDEEMNGKCNFVSGIIA